MDFKFNLDEKVKVKSKGKTGTVRTQKFESYLIKGSQSISILYYINFGNYMCDWVREDDLESLERFNFDNKFELNLLDLRIDTALAEGKFDLIKRLLEEKKKYTK